jgi:predicted lipid-binding transport protein (Tim44 family)
MSGTGFDATPQFDKAEYLGESGADRCAACNQPIADYYYRTNGAMTCPNCAQSTRSAVPRDTHAAYMRALLFGCGAAVLGLILYSAFGIFTGLVIGYLSLGVGYLVGKAMMTGSRGIGGRRYQVTAVLLTYAAVSLSAIPMAISMLPKRQAARREMAQRKQMAADEQRRKLADEQKQLEQEFGKQYTAAAPNVAPKAQQAVGSGEQTSTFSPEVQPSQSAAAQGEAAKKPRIHKSFGAAIGYLALIGLASPFLDLQDPLHGAIGLIILLVGVQIAWKLTAAKAPEISGPFRNSSQAPAATS